MEDFKDNVKAEIDDLNDQYQKDAAIQKHIAKSDFKNMIEASLLKLHNLTGITDEEKEIIRDQIAAKQEGFGPQVMTWITAVNTHTDKIADDLYEEMCDILSDFEDEMATNPIPDDSDDPDASAIAWLQQKYDDNHAEVQYKKGQERDIGNAQEEEIK
jgi:hypothetical protein